MTVRREIVEPRRETGARRREDPSRTRAVRGGSEGRARWPKARRSSGSAIVVEAFMINAGYTPTVLDAGRGLVTRSLNTCPSLITISRAA